MKYDILYVDPPWCYDDKCMHRGGAERHYQTITIETLKSLKVNDIMSDNSVMFLWATGPMLTEAIDLIPKWGFTYKTLAFVWVKTTKSGVKLTWGMGSSTRANAEYLLLAVKGKGLKRVNAGIHSIYVDNSYNDDEVVFNPRMKHSRKPSQIRDLISKLYGDGYNKIELFATEVVDGWKPVGYEVDGLDVQDSLAKLAG